ncbi:hypothetical protein [[Mycoplasma] anseris]|uniref:Uncharacterized protein n=1 Tax=[Mycoplasma] anseris TaxID=92400 RepID=A0A2Z4ND39_9BACT|nr:hypothetical protein [[Mycoplasma] anseris]AWX69427.1 hypothetical protein DP065_01500 [[Mycoplasma] anseris]
MNYINNNGIVYEETQIKAFEQFDKIKQAFIKNDISYIEKAAKEFNIPLREKIEYKDLIEAKNLIIKYQEDINFINRVSLNINFRSKSSDIEYEKLYTPITFSEIREYEILLFWTPGKEVPHWRAEENYINSSEWKNLEEFVKYNYEYYLDFVKKELPDISDVVDNVMKIGEGFDDPTGTPLDLVLAGIKVVQSLVWLADFIDTFVKDKVKDITKVLPYIVQNLYAIKHKKNFRFLRSLAHGGWLFVQNNTKNFGYYTLNKFFNNYIWEIKKLMSTAHYRAEIERFKRDNLYA